MAIFLDIAGLLPYTWMNSQRWEIIKVVRLYKIPYLISYHSWDRFLRTLQLTLTLYRIEGEQGSDSKLIHALEISRKSLKMLAVYIISCIICFFSGHIFYFCSQLFAGEDSFIKVFNLESKSILDRDIVLIYFASTTLTTVGLGDYVPVSSAERCVACLLLSCGVFFSIWFITRL